MHPHAALSRLLTTWIATLSAIVQTVHALPLQKRDSGASSGIIVNFQDLSAVLSLLASETVEQKICNPRSSEIERMTTVWSIFGMIGAMRAYFKIAWGLPAAESAGLELTGAGAFTTKKTLHARSVRPVGSTSGEQWWQDDRGLLLGKVDVVGSPWQRPHVIVVGRTCSAPTSSTTLHIVMLAATTLGSALPTALIWILANSAWNKFASISLYASLINGVVTGWALPRILEWAKSADIPLLGTLADSRFKHPVHDADAAISNADLTMILWRPEGAPAVPHRSADHPGTRALAAFSILTMLLLYISHYLLLGEVDSTLNWVWFASQLFILCMRLLLWSNAARLMPARTEGAFYIVAGSLTDTPLQPEPRHIMFGDVMDPQLVRFAIACAASRSDNGSDMPWPTEIRIDALRRLIDVGLPKDLLQSSWFCFDGTPPRRFSDIRIIGLPWPFIVEVYATQGLNLDYAPPELISQLTLAAVCQGHVFLGLTVVRPIDVKPSSSSRSLLPEKAVGTIEANYAVLDDIFDGTVSPISTSPGVQDDPIDPCAFARFRESVTKLRAMARSNGPSHCEIRSRYIGPRDPRGVAVPATWTEPSLKSALQFVQRRAAEEEVPHPKVLPPSSVDYFQGMANSIL